MKKLGELTRENFYDPVSLEDLKFIAKQLYHNLDVRFHILAWYICRMENGDSQRIRRGMLYWFLSDQKLSYYELAEKYTDLSIYPPQLLEYARGK